MRNRCLQVEEEIWEYARGAELSEEARRHMDECRECADALREVERIHGAMESAKIVPDAPDFRAEVLAKITTRRGIPAWSWAGACALALALLAVGWTTLTPPHPEPTPEPEKRMVKQLPTEKLAPEPPVVTDSEPKKQELEMAKGTGVDNGQENVITPKKKPGHRVPPKPRRTRQPKTKPVEPFEEKQMIAQNQDTNRPEAVQKPEESEVALKRPVAIAIVKWPSRLDRNEPLDYSYTEHNTETGETTTCVAKRSGDSVEIYMETTNKEKKDSKTIKGSLDNEANRNV